jgi:DNA-binding GntR family transcriptional regulator
MLQKKRTLAYQILREKILTGKLQPGVNLDVDELSADFGMSSTSIQEALQQLESDSLVTIESHSAKVTQINREVFEEIFEMLGALQIIGGRIACQKMNDFDLTELEAILHRLEGEISNPEAWSQAETQFHSLLCEKANMPLLKTMLLQVTDHWHRLRRHCLGEVFARRIPVAQQEYRDLLTTLRTRNTDHVTQIMLEHHQRALDDYMTHLNSQDTEQ